MNLENRVETLEHEFKILKNEIEETLLEIQNQVLIHYYPALRAEDSTPPQESLKPVTNRSKPAQDWAPEVGNPAKGQGAATGAVGVQMREISLHKRTEPAQEEDLLPLDVQGHPADLSVTPHLLSQLSMWSTCAVERIGKVEATQMVESCTEAIGCTPAVKAALRQLIVLCRPDGPPPQVDTATLMDLFLKLNKLFAEMAHGEPQGVSQPKMAPRERQDG